VLRLNEAEKKSFLKILYTIMMQDKHLSDEEEKTIKLIAKEIFQLKDYDETNLITIEKTAKEINKIKRETAIISLVEIMIYFAKKSSGDQVSDFLRQVFDNVAMSGALKNKIELAIGQSKEVRSRVHESIGQSKEVRSRVQTMGPVRKFLLILMSVSAAFLLLILLLLSC